MWTYCFQNTDSNISFSYKFDNIQFIGYIEPVLVILHEKELTWAGRLPHKHHTCMISALSISTTLKQHPLIWSATVSSDPTIATEYLNQSLYSYSFLFSCVSTEFFMLCVSESST